MNPGEPWNIAQAFEALAVADGAGHRFPGAAIGYQSLALLDTAFRNVSDESGMRIAALDSGGVLRQGNDAISQRLRAARWQRQAHAAPIDPALRHRVGLHHLVPNRRLQRGEKFYRLVHFLI